MAEDMPGVGAAVGGTTVVIPGEMAARVDRLPMSAVAWELALLVQVGWACSASVAGIAGRLYPFIWQPRHVMTSFEYSVLYALGTGISVLIGGYAIGWLADKIGRRRLFLTFSIGAIAVILVYTQVPLSNGILWLLGFPLGFFASGYFSGMGAFLTELYPTRLRGSGQGFCYNFGRGIGALFPFLVGYLSQSLGLADAIAIFAVLAYCLFFLAAYALPETRGKVLHADA